MGRETRSSVTEQSWRDRRMDLQESSTVRRSLRTVTMENGVDFVCKKDAKSPARDLGRV